MISLQQSVLQYLFQETLIVNAKKRLQEKTTQKGECVFCSYLIVTITDFYVQNVLESSR